jgi:hypothetical protein
MTQKQQRVLCEKLTCYNPKSKTICIKTTLHLNFSNKFRINSNFLLFTFSNSEYFHWFVIMSFNVSWLKNKSSNCWLSGLAMKTADKFTTSWQRKGQIFASFCCEICRNCQLLKLQHKLAFLNYVIATEKHITIYSSYCKNVRSLLHCQPVSVTSYLLQTGS